MATKNLSFARTMTPTLLVLVTLYFSAEIAHAGPLVTYDFTGNAANNPLGLGVGDLGTTMVTVSQDGLSVDITGKDFDLSNGTSANLDRSGPGGLGVVDNAGFARVGTDEAIEFDFDPATVIGISTLILEVGQPTGSFDLYVNNLFAETVGWDSGGGNFVTHTFTSMPTGSILEFRGKTFSFRISELTVEVVPEPGEILLLATGAFGLIVFARKRFSNSAA